MFIEQLDQTAYLDIAIGSAPCGRIVVQLFEEKAPVACDNFLTLLPRLQGTYFHRVIKNFMIQGGDVVCGQAAKYAEGKAGTGLHPKGLVFEDENTSEPLDRPFLLCMANLGEPDSNKAQWFITCAPATHLQGKHTVFGEVIHGKSVVRAIEKVSTTKDHVPVESELPVITETGIWTDGDAVPIFNASYDPLEGDIYEEYPDDDTNIEKGSFKSVYDAATIIKNSGGALFKKEDYKNALLKYKKALRYVMEYIPDEELEAEYSKKYLDLKKKLYLNLSLVSLKLGDFNKCAEYCLVLLDMDLSSQEKAKTLYRLGGSFCGLKHYKEAITTFETAREIMADPAIDKDLKKAEELLAAEKQAERNKYAKFFGTKSPEPKPETNGKAEAEKAEAEKPEPEAEKPEPAKTEKLDTEVQPEPEKPEANGADDDDKMDEKEDEKQDVNMEEKDDEKESGQDEMDVQKDKDV